MNWVKNLRDGGKDGIKISKCRCGNNAMFVELRYRINTDYSVDIKVVDCFCSDCWFK